MTQTSPLPFGSTIGMIGGGQLGRMMASAAARLGYRIVVLDPDAACPAAQVANDVIVAHYDDREALAELGRRVAVVTYEFENVPVEPVRELSRSVPVYPPPEALEVAQDRVVEKAFLNGIGIRTAEWRAVDDVSELDHAFLSLGGDCILKTRRLGYDGKGQAVLRANSNAGEAFLQFGGVPCILEKKIPFDREVSIIAARGIDGRIACYDPAENVHRLGILKSSTVPADLTKDLQVQAAEVAGRILQQVGYVGVLGVEFFVARSGELLVNEIAPRVHNSGHWTEAACLVSQFEQHIRAVAGLPLGSPVRHLDAVMENLIGPEIERAAELCAEQGTMLTLYGKAEARQGRKMGHFTRVSGVKLL